ncbi:MAG: cation transporter [Bacilli bacterium]|nr:cation transporter [Bacilli bacterium]
MKTERNILIAFILNIIFSLIELIGGVVTGSIAILSDSIHDFGDALSIGFSYFLERKSKQKPDLNHTYGYVKYSVIGSVITTTILIVGSIFVIYESVVRIINPVDLNYNGMIILAIFEIVINFIASYVTKDGDSLNQRSVNLHMLEDVLGWIVVFIGSVLMKFTNISLIDSILSIGVAIFILYNALKNLNIIISIFLETTPKNIDIEKIKKEILKIDGILDVHHIHIRSIDGFSNFATLHVVVKEYSKIIKIKVKKELEKYGICHSTIELELVDENCHEKKCNLNKIRNNLHYHD